MAIEALAKADLLVPNAEIEIISITSNPDSGRTTFNSAEYPVGNAMKKVLIAEDDLLMADMLEEMLADNGYEICGIARNVAQGVELAEKHRPDLLLLDIRLAERGLGNEIVARIPKRSDMGIIYISGNANRIKLSREDGHGFLKKPYRPNEILQALKVVEAAVKEGNNLVHAPNNFEFLYHDGMPQSKEQYVQQIEGLLRRQVALTDFGSYALREQELSNILSEAAWITAECLNVPFAKICRYRPEENDLIVEAGIGWKEGVVGHVISRADMSSPQGRAFKTEKAIICNNIGLETTFVLPTFYIEHKIISTLDVVIRKQDGSPWGILEIDNPAEHHYDDNDITFMEGFANILAEAVETAKRNKASKVALDLLNDVLADRDRRIHAQSRLLAEKGEFAQELQHRVRNNLQLVYGMLNRQIEHQAEASDVSGISAIARRVMTLAKVYDHLLGTGMTKSTDFGSYLKSLCESFRDLQDVVAAQIVLVCHVETVMLDLDTATALGLVVAELIANSYMHAFPTKLGTVKVSLRHNKADAVGWLDFADDGVGFTPKTESKRRGIGLVKRLIEQIDGEASFQSDRGTTWTLKFPVPAALAQVGLGSGYV